MSLPPGLLLYRWATRLAGPLAYPALHYRVRRGKEDPLRLDEREGRASRNRPNGHLVWLHGASVGESRVVLTLVRALLKERPHLHCLVTTGTTTSAHLMSDKLPANAIHQYVPIDRPRYVRRFLDYWQPDLGIFVESELWPNLLLSAQRRNIPMALVNARMNSSSVRGWLANRASARRLLSCFSWIGAADQRTADGLSAILDDAVPMVGNLKIDSEADTPPDSVLDPIRGALGNRPVWLAASTHPGEEEIILTAHQNLLKSRPDALLILAPRHPDRGDALSDTIAAHDLTHARRSENAMPTHDHSVWLADTMGEMACWFAVSPVSLIAGSLIDGIGGHNPVEATQGGSAVLTGPYTASFDDVFTAYAAHDAAVRVSNAEDLTSAVSSAWTGTDASVAAARQAVRSLSSGALNQTMTALRPMLAGTFA